MAAGANPPFSFAERKCAVDGGKETGALPGQGFGRDPCAGVTNGSWACAALSCKGTNKQRQSGFDRAVTDCLCCLFAAAVRCGAGDFCVGFHVPAPSSSRLRQQNDSRHNRFTTRTDAVLQFAWQGLLTATGLTPCSGFSLTPMKRRVLSCRGKREWGFSPPSPAAAAGAHPPARDGQTLFPNGHEKG